MSKSKLKKNAVKSSQAFRLEEKEELIKEVVKNNPLPKSLSIQEKAKILLGRIDPAEFGAENPSQLLSDIKALIDAGKPITEKQKSIYYSLLIGTDLDSEDLDFKWDTRSNVLKGEFLFRYFYLRKHLFQQTQPDIKLLLQNALKHWDPQINAVVGGSGDQILVAIKSEFDLNATSGEDVRLYSFLISLVAKEFMENYPKGYKLNIAGHEICIDLRAFIHVLHHYGQKYFNNPAKTYFEKDFPFTNFFEVVQELFALVHSNPRAGLIEVDNNKPIHFFYKRVLYELWVTKSGSDLNLGSFYPLEESKALAVMKSKSLEVVNEDFSFFYTKPLN